MGNEMIEGQIAATIKRLDEIAEFGDDWDSHGAKRINWSGTASMGMFWCALIETR